VESIRLQAEALGAAGKEAQGFFRRASGDVFRLAVAAEKTMAGLEEAADGVGAASRQIEGTVADVRNGRGTLGALATDPGYAANLNRSIEQLTALIEDLRRNPKKYVKFSIF